MIPLPELRALVADINQKAAAATAGPWWFTSQALFGCDGMTTIGATTIGRADAAFIVALVNAWPTIAAAIDALAAQVEELERQSERWKQEYEQSERSSQRWFNAAESYKRQLTDLRIEFAARVDELQHEIMAHQVGDGYEKGYEHGDLVAAKYKAERDALAARLDAAEKVCRALAEYRSGDGLLGLRWMRVEHALAAWLEVDR